MKKKTLCCPMVCFQHLLLQIGCSSGPIGLDFTKLPIGCVGLALLFDDPKKAKAFVEEEPLLWGAFTMKTGLPPWDNAKGSG
jgi:hypothetical protein